MNHCAQIAKHFRSIYFGGNWSVANFKEELEDINKEQANTILPWCNSITALVYHTCYYVSTLVKVLEGGPLEAKDALSFDHPEINSEEDWQLLKNTSFSEANRAAELIETLDESMLWKEFTDQKHGNYHSNIHGIIEHCHYHLGQIVIIKKMLLPSK